MADPSSEQKKKISGQDEATQECDQIDSDIAALRALYEQFFLGMERQPPTIRHDQLKKRLGRLRSSFVNQTALRFKIDSLHNRFLTYERLWTRTLQEIENGTYHRDVYKARMHAKKRAELEQAAVPAVPAVPAVARQVADAPAGSKAAAPAAAPSRTSAAPPAGVPAPAGVPGLSDQKLKAIYDAYVMAKRRCNEDVSKISFDSVAASLKKQVPELMKQHKAKTVDFKIVIKDGKATLRAVPKE